MGEAVESHKDRDAEGDADAQIEKDEPAVVEEFESHKDSEADNPRAQSHQELEQSKLNAAAGDAADVAATSHAGQDGEKALASSAGAASDVAGALPARPLEAHEAPHRFAESPREPAGRDERDGRPSAPSPARTRVPKAAPPPVPAPARARPPPAASNDSDSDD